MKNKLENIILFSVFAIVFNFILSNTAAACSSGSCVQACATGYTSTGESCTVSAADLSMPGVCCTANPTTPTTSSGSAYTNQEKIPGYDPTNCFPDYVKQIINFCFAVIGILAMFMLAIGAYQYLMSAGNIGSAESAKSTIGSALGGLALGLCAWLILNTINPDLVSMKDPSGLNCNGGSGGGGTSGAGNGGGSGSGW